MPEWVNEWGPVLQLLLNAGALIGGAISWKLYIENLKAASAVKEATIQNVEKSRDHGVRRLRTLRSSLEVVRRVWPSGFR